MATKKPKVYNLTTLTGIPLEDIPAKMTEHLPPGAYKAIGGGADLTDISPGYMLERLTEIFGMRGIGWDLEWQKEDMDIYGEITTSRTNSAFVVAHLRYAHFVFTLFDPDSAEMTTIKLPTSGMSVNLPSFAEEGARTNSISTAVKSLCFQLDVYKGLLDHHNAGKTQPQGGNQSDGQTEKKTTGRKTAAKKDGGGTKANGGFDVNKLNQAALKKAKDTEIGQLGTPFDGQKLGAVIENDKLLGPQVIGYLAGVLNSPRTKKRFAPSGEEQEKLKLAALYVWLHEAKAIHDANGNGEAK